MDNLFPATLKDAEQFVSDIKKRCKTADNAYTISAEDTQNLLKIIEIFGKKIDDYYSDHPALKAKNIFINTVDKNVAEAILEFLGDVEIDPAIEYMLCSSLIRIRGF